MTKVVLASFLINDLSVVVISHWRVSAWRLQLPCASTNRIFLKAGHSQRMISDGDRRLVQSMHDSSSCGASEYDIFQNSY